MTRRANDERGQVAVAVLLTIAALVLAVGIVVGGYQLGWWLKGNAVNRTAKINRTSYEVQQTYREKALDDIASVRAVDAQIAEPSTAEAVKSQLRAQRIAIVTQTCDAISRLTTSGAGVDPDIQSFHDGECL